jgi:hypothetical protein
VKIFDWLCSVVLLNQPRLSDGAAKVRWLFCSVQAFWKENGWVGLRLESKGSEIRRVKAVSFFLVGIDCLP